MYVPVYVSESDFNLTPTIKHLHDKFPLEGCLHLLWGFDKDYNGGDFYEVDECEHINRQGKRVVCKRYVGCERLDKAWLDGALASDTAKLAAKGDRSLLNELASLGGRYFG